MGLNAEKSFNRRLPRNGLKHHDAPKRFSTRVDRIAISVPQLALHDDEVFRLALSLFLIRSSFCTGRYGLVPIGLNFPFHAPSKQ